MPAAHRGYTPAVPAERIAENLAYINWTVLASLAVGGFGAVALGRLRTSATRGYLAFTALCAAAFAVLAYLSDLALPAAIAGSTVHADPSWDIPRRIALLATAGIGLVYALALAWGRGAPALAIAGSVTGGAALLAGALGWGAGPIGAAPLAIQLVVLALATGGVFASMILGHWYLVTPRLPEAPLILFSRLLFGVWVAAGTGGGGPFSALTGPWALFVWLRLLVGLVFPLAVSWAAIQTARSRSMESATGLLYIDVGSIAAGTILAAGLYFGAGMLV